MAAAVNAWPRRDEEPVSVVVLFLHRGCFVDGGDR